MWCEKWDGDLYKLVPDAAKVLAPVKDVKLQTYGRLTDGKLNHPACWNTSWGLTAFFGFQEEEATSQWKPAQMYTNDQIVHCTFEEAVRDCWGHDYAISINMIQIWSMANPVTRDALYALLFHARGVQLLSEQDQLIHRVTVLNTLVQAVAWLQSILPGKGVSTLEDGKKVKEST